MRVEPNSEIRIDQALVLQGLVPSRTLASRMIEAGQVFVDSVKVAKSSLRVPPNAKISVAENDLDRFVSRGGLKLEAALSFFALDVKGKRCLDVGISTGGFTDCLLQRGAAEIVGIDVGHDQLAAQLRGESRLVVYEGVNARELSKFAWLQPFDLIVMDVSFISLTKVIPEVVKFLKVAGEIVVLLKPQFEVGREFLDKNGIVSDNFDFSRLGQQIALLMAELGIEVRGQISSPIRGGDGNKEFFIYGRKN